MSAPAPRRRTGAAVLAALALAALLAACGSHPQATAPHFAKAGTQLDLALPAAVDHLRFTDADGRTVRLSDFAGKTIVLGDVLTLCQEHCPIDTAAFVLMARQYAATAPDPSDTVFLSITVDAARDTPAQLAAYRREYVGSATTLPQWQLLTGSAATLRTLWAALHVYVQKVPEDDAGVRNWRTGKPLTFDIDHSDDVFFIDGNATERYLFAGQPYLHGAKVPASMQRFMSSAGHRNEKHGHWTAAEGLSVLSWLQQAPPAD